MDIPSTVGKLSKVKQDIIDALPEGGEATASEIAGILKVSKETVSGAMQFLRNHGYFDSRERPGPTRALLFTRTAKKYLGNYMPTLAVCQILRSKNEDYRIALIRHYWPKMDEPTKATALKTINSISSRGYWK